MTDDFAELPLGDQQPADPALDLVARPPAFDVPAACVHDGEG